jgi:hypothetical protein
MNEYQKRLQELSAARAKARQQAEFERMTLMAQFQRFKLCTCIAMGRYSTCCQRLENVRDGFFYINGRFNGAR